MAISVCLDVVTCIILLAFMTAFNFATGNLFLASFDIDQHIRRLVESETPLSEIAFFAIPIPIYTSASLACVFVRNNLLSMSALEITLIGFSPFLLGILTSLLDFLLNFDDTMFVLKDLPVRTGVSLLTWDWGSCFFLSSVLAVGGFIGWKLSNF